MNLEALKARNQVPIEKVVDALVQYHFALSALKSLLGPTWADGPGYYISRLWRLEPDNFERTT